jgi:hypothetical protein
LIRNYYLSQGSIKKTVNGHAGGWRPETYVNQVKEEGWGATPIFQNIVFEQFG